MSDEREYQTEEVGKGSQGQNGTGESLLIIPSSPPGSYTLLCTSCYHLDFLCQLRSLGWLLYAASSLKTGARETYHYVNCLFS